MSGRGGFPRGGGGFGRGHGRQEGGRGGRDGGRDRYEGGGKRAGRGAGGGRGRGRDARGFGGREQIPDLSGIQMVKTNILPADLLDGFDFYRYTVDVKDQSGQSIDSRSRRRCLFRVALFDTLLKEKAKEDRKSLSRLVYFQGSSFLSAVPIEGLEAKDLPLQVLDGSTTDGETFTIKQMFHFGRPKELDEVFKETKGNVITMDCCCNGCARRFADGNSLIQHCQETGHLPAYDMKDENTLTPDRSVFLEYVNVVLSQSLAETDLAKWGRDFIDPKSEKICYDNRGSPLATVFKAYKCEFGLNRQLGPNKAFLTLTVDLKSKVMRGRSLLDEIFSGKGMPGTYGLTEAQENSERMKWRGQIVIYKGDYKCYSIVNLRFDHSAESLLVEGLIKGRPCTHALYFKERKNISLKYPNARPMVEVLGRRNESIYFPAELVFGEELDARVKEQLPKIASYRPEERNDTVDKIMAQLSLVDDSTAREDILAQLNPRGKHKEKAGGLLAACGITLRRNKEDASKAGVINAKAVIMSIPQLLAAGVEVPEKFRQNWAPCLKNATFNVQRNDQVTLDAVVFYNDSLDGCTMDVYNKIQKFVNGFGSRFRLGDNPRMEKVATERGGFQNFHCKKVEQCFSSEESRANTFVLDFIRPGSKFDPDYHALKQMLGAYGYLSQFVSFKTHDHGRPRDSRDQGKSNVILQGVARQILQKSGCRLWFVSLPKSLPLPAVLVGVDVYHAPRTFNPVTKKREARRSCAAIVVQVVRKNYMRSQMVEIYSETFARKAGDEFGLQHALTRTVSNAMAKLRVDPQCCIVWRDGISESSFDTLASEEIDGVRRGLIGPEGAGPASVASSPHPMKLPPGSAALSKPPAGVPLTYIICQKKIATKFLTFKVNNHKDFAGKYGAPPGTFVDGIQGAKYYTYYIQGRAPPNSTAKPVRYIVLQSDEELTKLRTPELTWALCHDYPNWTGPIKVPSVCMAAHKLAMLAGSMGDCGTTIKHSKFANTMHFL